MKTVADLLGFRRIEDASTFPNRRVHPKQGNWK